MGRVECEDLEQYDATIATGKYPLERNGSRVSITGLWTGMTVMSITE